MKGVNGKSLILFPFTYLGQRISVVSSYVFTNSAAIDRGQNDKNNKLREAIIGAIINERIPTAYYLTQQWSSLKTAVLGFLRECVSRSSGGGSGGSGGSYSRVEYLPAGGRGYNYDFSLVFTGADGVTTMTKRVEFKFNATRVSDTPQFVSPMKPSQYLSGSYEEYFYDGYMAKIATAAASPTIPIPIPDRTEWLKQIHHNAPACVKHLQDKYYAGCAESSQYTKSSDDIAFYQLAKKLSAESIYSFISNHDLNITKLSEYLRASQDGKIYMLFQPSPPTTALPIITLQCVDPADYSIVSCVKSPSRSRYECVTESGKKIRVLLRWKNGNGIAFPAFQIS